jgi:enoyl-CoA hydratase/carnithine racemase
LSDVLKLTVSGDIHVISLNRPEVGNALSPALVEALHEALNAVEAADGRALVLQGEGRNFCTGFDLSEAASMSDGDLLLRFVRIEQLLARLWSAPYATISVGQGRVFGAGADLFAACGQRIAMASATFGFPGAGFGLILGTRRLQARVGAVETHRLVAGGGVLDAEAAATFGLATVCATVSDLSDVLQDEISQATRLDTETYRRLRGVLAGCRADLDADLAALVRSAARPGLGARIAAYRDASSTARASAAGSKSS